MRKIFGHEGSQQDVRDVAKLDGMTCASIGIRRRKLVTEADYFAVVEAIFGFKRDLQKSFFQNVRAAIEFISAVPSGTRTKMRTAAILALPMARKRKHGKTERKAKHEAVAIPASAYSQARATEFYLSWEWRRLRLEVLKQHGRRCLCCGATPDNKSMHGQQVRIVVDHIKPLSKFWELRLTRSNLQVLCDECNQGKGSWDQTDWRPLESVAA